MKGYGLYYNLTAAQLVAAVHAMDFSVLEQQLAAAVEADFAQGNGGEVPVGMFSTPLRIPPRPTGMPYVIQTEGNPAAEQRRLARAAESWRPFVSNRRRKAARRQAATAGAIPPGSGSKLARKVAEGKLGTRW